MTRNDTSRRAVLATVGGAIGGAGAGYAGVVNLVTAGSDGDEPTDTDATGTVPRLPGDRSTETERDRETDESSGPPVVDAGADDPDRNLTVDLTVRDGDGRPVANEPVVLQDRGGTPDARFGTTGPRGRLRIVESVGPSPCNRQLVVLPVRDQRVSLGCNDGGKTVERTVEIDRSEATPARGEDPPVVDPGASPDHRLTVDVRVVDAEGAPVPGEPVVLQDRGGTPDARFGRTGADGRLRFLESVGPSPCNRQLLVLPARDRRASLGCNDGGASVEHVFDLGKPPGETDPRDPPVECEPTETSVDH